jgi:P27 family predicted phage terminase small subunit
VSARLPAPPSDLAARGRGRRFWKRVVGEWECSPTELELLAEACRTLDELDALRRAVAKQGATVAGSQGQPRAHPALAELRQARGELRRLFDALGIPQPLAGAAPAEDVVSLTSRRAQRAARARWAKRGSSGHA